MPQTNKLLKVALDTMHLTGVDGLCAPVTRGAGIVFMLHNVRPQSDHDFAPNRILEITPDFLEQVIGLVLEHGFEPVSLDRLHASMISGEKPERPFAVFTFDDGYRDNRDHALAIMEHHGIPFTVYVAPDFADGVGKLWWLTLEEALRRLDRVSVDVGGETLELACASSDQKQAAFDAIYWNLRPLADRDIYRVVDKIAGAAGVDPLAAGRDLVMDWDELRAFAAHPLVTIGGHTRSHISLAKYPDVEARQQMRESIARIEAELGQPCRHFSYPYGDAASAGAREFEIARELGVATAVTTAKGVLPAGGQLDLCAIPRCSLNGDFQDLRHVKVLMSGLPFAMLDLASKASSAVQLKPGGGPAGKSGAGGARGAVRAVGSAMKAPRQLLSSFFSKAAAL